ncbi:pteridine reductase [Methylophilus medardicus]|uniref:Pteridine reductase n=1 Tax=Methylophilus medardicus TaxID=2588534 RepID=A0A5B8CVZ2_9PROT|nr:pteridine reductase [Methylophilus medardicus]QDC50273.1 pteridine reductase [Methylophilus medardicus]QDC53978.1 pteridine reductase [Methylophilus medardicus]
MLITGGAKRVGAEITRALHQQGANILLHYHTSATEALALQTELNQLRPNSVVLAQANLLDIDTLPTLVNAALDHFGRLDVLINNASGYFPTPLGQIDLAQWETLMGSNLKAPLFLSQAASDALRASQGCIVNITDMHIERPKKNYMVYSAAKAGLVSLTKSLAQELAPTVRVNAVAPGPVLWPDDNQEFDAAYRQQVVNQTLLKRSGEPSDIAKAVKFLIFDAPFITGHVLAVDGGRHLSL